MNPLPLARPTRLPALAVTALLVLALGTVAASRITGVGASTAEPAARLEVREYRFEDRPDGGIAILEPGGRLAETVAPGENGFLRGTMRGLARERKRSGLGPEIPFQLVSYADGRFTLEDPATGRSIDLRSFGATNAAVFVRLMAGPRALAGTPNPPSP